MMRQRAELWLTGYIDTFRDGGGRLHPLMEMKRTHSWRVLDNAERIVGVLRWDEELSEAALAASLLHDTGRFPQCASYGTYYDGSSVDHGRLGAEVLAVSFPWREDDAGLREAIVGAVRLHNRRELPTEGDERTSRLAKLVRDSDKVDVLNLVRRYDEEGRIQELLPKIAPGEGLSSELLQEFSADGRCSYRNVRTLRDFLLLQLSWILDLNYGPSFRLLRESGWFQWVEIRLGRAPETEDLWRRVEDRMALEG